MKAGMPRIKAFYSGKRIGQIFNVHIPKETHGMDVPEGMLCKPATTNVFRAGHLQNSASAFTCPEPKLYNNPYISIGAPPMDTITYSTARANLASSMDRVCNDHEPLIITRNGEQSVVMLSLEDFKSLEETAYLLRSPANAKRLLCAVEALGQGKGKQRILAA